MGACEVISKVHAHPWKEWGGGGGGEDTHPELVTGDWEVWLPIVRIQLISNPAPSVVVQLTWVWATTTAQFFAGNSATAPFEP